MKTSIILTGIIPTLCAVKGSGAYNVVIANQAPTMAERLRVAANDDRIVITPLIAALAELSKATSFDDQQTAMEETIRQADDLLGRIHTGDVEHADVVHANAGDLIARIRADTAGLVDKFKCDTAILRRIQRDAGELAMIIGAEAREKTRDHDHSQIANRMSDMADRLEDMGYNERQRSLAAIGKHALEIAA